MQIDVEPLLPGRDEKPTKYTSSDEKLHIKCQLRYVDLEGLSDGRSMKTILPQIAPRKLVSCKTYAINHNEITFFIIDYCSWFSRCYRGFIYCLSRH